MDTLTGAQAPTSGGALKGLAWLAAGLATVAAAAVAAVLALFFAATVLVIAVMASALVTLTGVALRARRSVQPKDPTLLEARNVGGHSWVAYGWDRSGR
jgi:heme/copper-type cytochrome/quinol oxidase subunit 2